MTNSYHMVIMETRLREQILFIYGVRGLRKLHSNGAIRLSFILYAKNSMGRQNHEENYISLCKQDVGEALREDKAFWVKTKGGSIQYLAAVNEGAGHSDMIIWPLQIQLTRIRQETHCYYQTKLNLQPEMSIDSILIRMAQQQRKLFLTDMRKRLPKMRCV